LELKTSYEGHFRLKRADMRRKAQQPMGCANGYERLGTAAVVDTGHWRLINGILPIGSWFLCLAFHLVRQSVIQPHRPRKGSDRAVRQLVFVIDSSNFPII
jgi:hypothetical protein